MTRSVTLNARQRQALLNRYRKDPDPEVRFCAHILLLLADGYTWATVAALSFCSSRTIDRWVKRFHDEGVEAVTGAQARPPLSLRRRMGRSSSPGPPLSPHATSASFAAASAAKPSRW